MSYLDNIIGEAKAQWARDDRGVVFEDDENPNSVSYYRIVNGRVGWILAEGNMAASKCWACVFEVDFSEETGLMRIAERECTGIAEARRIIDPMLGVRR